MMTNSQRQKWLDYDGFVEKHKPKLTTDDCYTPEPVYNVVRDWVCEEYGVDASTFVRPFYPGGDYEFYDYPRDCVVVDNPPFSILAQIIRFYVDAGIKFFLFAPSMTIFTSYRKKVCSLCCNTKTIYENGAQINTSFLTNLESPGVRSVPELYKRLKGVIKDKKSLPKYQYPDELLTATKINFLSERGVDFKIGMNEMFFTRELDSQKKYDKGIFGSGFLISERKAAELREAMEREKKKDVICWELSEREKEIIKQLGENKF